MCLTDWLAKLAKKMKWYDISLLKLVVFFTTLFMITAWTGFRELVLSYSWHWYLGIAVVLAISLLRKLF